MDFTQIMDEEYKIPKQNKDSYRAHAIILEFKEQIQRLYAKLKKAEELQYKQNEFLKK